MKSVWLGSFIALLPLLVTAAGATEPAAAEMLKVPGGTFTMGADGIGFLDRHPANGIDSSHRRRPSVRSSASMIGHSSVAPFSSRSRLFAWT